jgi:hypothetical protein
MVLDEDIPVGRDTRVRLIGDTYRLSMLLCFFGPAADGSRWRW